jgi:hypothetical protein
METNVKQIVFSTATCKKCGDVLVSKYRHDYVMCTCDNKSMLDGGTDYQRYGGKNLSLLDLSGTVYLSDGFEKCRTAPIWGSYGKDGTKPLKFMSVAEMDTEHLEIVIKDMGSRIEKWRLDLMKQELEQRTK